MKKQGIPLLVTITVAFVAFTLGYYIGRTHNPSPVTLSIPPSMMTAPPETTEAFLEETVPEPTVSFPIDINSAGKEEFMMLPGIGEVLADRILAYREEIGKFESEYDLLNVEGIGKKRFEEILDLIKVGG